MNHLLRNRFRGSVETHRQRVLDRRHRGPDILRTSVGDRVSGNTPVTREFRPGSRFTRWSITYVLNYLLNYLTTSESPEVLRGETPGFRVRIYGKYYRVYLPPPLLRGPWKTVGVELFPTSGLGLKED